MKKILIWKKKKDYIRYTDTELKGLKMSSCKTKAFPLRVNDIKLGEMIKNANK